MGMTIDTAKTVLFNMLGEKVICEPTEQNKAIAVAIKTMQNYQMMQADYNARLKADMVTILEEIQSQIDDLWEATWHSDYRGGFKDGCIESNNLIQDKINSLKEDT